MSLGAATSYSEDLNSYVAGKEAGARTKEALGGREPTALLVYASASHDGTELLRGLREATGGQAQILGSSTQGLIMVDKVTEGERFVGVMALAGDEIQVASAVEREIQQDTLAKGRALGRKLSSSLGATPELLVLLYDPVCGVDIRLFQAGIREELPCVIVGGGAGHEWSFPTNTYQFYGSEVIQHGAVALAIQGPISLEMGLCHGASPSSRSMTVTRAANNQLLEIDGRPAFEVWRETTGTVKFHEPEAKPWAIGIDRPKSGTDDTDVDVILAVFEGDEKTGALFLQGGISEGASIRFYHRTVPAALESTVDMGKKLSSRLGARKTWMTLAFECGARTSPFLGLAETLRENSALQRQLGDCGPWLGMMAWSELAPVGREPSVLNFAYLLAILTLD